jgi:hypothetical protein
MIRITVRVVPKSSRVKVEDASDEEGQRLRVHLTRPAQDGEANRQLCEVLAQYYGVKKYQVSIVSGESSRMKIVRIDGITHTQLEQ